MPLRRFKFAMCQLSSTDVVDENLAAASKLIEQAVAKGAKLVCLPEVFSCLSPDRKAKLTASEPAGKGPVQTFLRECARRHRIHLAAGSIIVRGSTKLYNRSLFFGPDGKLLGSYDKIHLFRYTGPDRVYDEGRDFYPGKKVVTVASKLGRIGLSVCYDVRFPLLYSAMKKPDIIMVPAAFTRSTGKAHWESLLRARAIENQAYVIGTAQCGTHSEGVRTWGHSMAIDPWGKTIAKLGMRTGVAIGEFDPHELAMIREKLQTLSHRRKVS